jgi:hypothetical protein
MYAFGLAFIILLMATSYANAAGFNINPEVTFTPIASTYRTIGNTTGCPLGFVGKFTFTALLTNKIGSPAIPGITVRVVTLTNGNVLLDPQTNAVLGGEGAEMVVPKVGQYADGILTPSQSVEVPFVLCLKSTRPFQFFVDVLGIVTRLVSIDWSGTRSGNNTAETPAISADGRFVAFVSTASDLVTRDTNGVNDVFVRDLLTGKTTLVSINWAGTDSGNGITQQSPNSLSPPQISANGRFVAFASWASDLVPNDSNGHADVFVRDLRTGVTELVSVNRDGIRSGNRESFGPVLSADGRFVGFSSYGSDLVANDNNGEGDAFLRDRQTRTTMLVSINRSGTSSGNGYSQFAHLIGTGGRLVAFGSSASNLVAENDTNGGYDVFVRDLQTGVTTLVSVNHAGTGAGNEISYIRCQPSADGRFVAFESLASDLVPQDTNTTYDVFVRDLLSRTTMLVSANETGSDSGNNSSEYGHRISADGRIVVFGSRATDLVGNDTNGVFGNDIFVRNLETGTTALVSVNRFGTSSANGDSRLGALSGDGRFVVFASNAKDLVDAYTNFADLYVRDLQTEITTLLSVDRIENRGGNSASIWISVISTDNRFVAFDSYAQNLVTTPMTGSLIHNVFVRPLP